VLMIGDRWNVTEAETQRRYPCDELVAHPALQAWRGVTVAARSKSSPRRACQLSSAAS
jgi:hypothetical protein